MSIPVMQAEAYREEVFELLVEVEETLLEIEKNPEDTEAVNRLFRAMHTIKGSGNMFGFNDIADFTHHVETVLDKVRDGSIPVSRELITLILSSADHIKSMIHAAAGQSETDVNRGNEIISRLEAILQEGGAKVAEQPRLDKIPPPEPETQEEKTYRIRFHPDKELFILGTNPATIMEDLRNLGPCKIIAHGKDIPLLNDLDPTKCHLFWDIILTTERGVNAIRDIFIFFEENSLLQIAIIDESCELSDETDYKKLGEILVEKSDLSAPDLEQILKSRKKIGENLVEADMVDPSLVESALIEQQQVQENRQKRKEAQTQSSIRVPAEKLDSLVALVGELVTAQARLSQKTAEHNNSELMTIAEEVERLVSSLRENTMSIRMVQIGIIFSSLKRLVRDLSEELGKQIVMTTIGGDTELDKTVIEQLKDPLLHIIRNSIDHGIEEPEERIRKGKPPHGTIHLSAEHEGAHVSIHIIDDGKGLDKEKLKQKAIEKGLIGPDAELSDKEAFQLIFAPGLSTANRVSDLSGRGVGMDIVKRNIESLRGTVSVESIPASSTTISLKLPLTLAIIDGLMVTINENYYILPLANVEECVELTAEQANRIRGRNILNVRGEVVPYIRLRNTFGINGNPPPIEHIVISEVNNRRIGFVVDHVIGSHQTVIKSLGPAFKEAHEISGATILGDGRVALILDVNRLV